MYVHTPVLLGPVLSFLKPTAEESCLVDATLGEGGHAEAFLESYPGLSLYGVEKDEELLRRAESRLERFAGRVRLFRLSHADFFERYDSVAELRPDRILFDLGISMYHFEASGRGFSFGKDEPLDMRLDPTQGRTAAELLNSATEGELAELLQKYGEERMARQISRAIVRERTRRPIARATSLAQIVARAVPPALRYGRIHPATRTFQALRIAVNDELGELSKGLSGAFATLKPGGRLGVIAFHSLEDRLAKRFFRERNRACTCPPDWPICQCGGKRELFIVTRKPVTADEAERKANPASRSAKLRVVEKL